MIGRLLCAGVGPGMDNWDEVRTALQVAREGTVSGAAAVLKVHHATVIRHIDQLEARLGTKLFQRHARGYTPTEAGRDLMQVAQATEDQMAQLEARLKGQGDEISGELIVTTLSGFAETLVPLLTRFREEHPALTVRYLTGNRLFRMEYGEAHVAIRAGERPQEPDNVVQPFCVYDVGLYASRDYVAAQGAPKTDAELKDHRFVTFDPLDSRANFYRWLWQRVPAEAAVFRSTEPAALLEAVCAGAGLGFIARVRAERRPELVEVMPPRKEWASQMWLVTHVDLHRTAKVQALLGFLKREMH